jgi:MbtH protein
MTEGQDPIIYRVVVNQEEQYSIWRASLRLPPGWRDVGKTGSEDECVAYINSVWTDMRPLSVRKQLAAMQQTTHGDVDPSGNDSGSLGSTSNIGTSSNK